MDTEAALTMAAAANVLLAFLTPGRALREVERRVRRWEPVGLGDCATDLCQMPAAEVAPHTRAARLLVLLIVGWSVY